MIRHIPMALAVVVLIAIGATAMENNGAENITLDGGSRGRIMFPHHRHQEALKDCQVCHKLFPKEKDGIKRLKSEGKLNRKQVMNTLCVKCHKANAREGKRSGPRTCTQCHVRDS